MSALYTGSRLLGWREADPEEELLSGLDNQAPPLDANLDPPTFRLHCYPDVAFSKSK